MAEIWERLSSFQGVPTRDGPQEAGHITSNSSFVNQGSKVRIEQRKILMAIGNACHEQTLGETEAEHPGKEICETIAKEKGSIVQRVNQRREKMLEGIAIGEDKAGDPLGMLSNGQLANGTSRIVPNQRDIVQIQCLQKISHELSNAEWGEISIGGQGREVTTEREIWCNTAELLK